MRKLLFTAIAILLFAGSLLAQKTVTGKVTDEKGNPVPNVSVIVKGTTTGTVTKSDGTYSLSVPSTATTLVFSAVDMQTAEVAVGNQTTINSIMKNEDKAMSEVVVVGYQTLNKRALSGAVSKVGGEQLANKPVLSFDQALTGKAAGVQINTSSGLVGDAVLIRVRGAASIGNSSQPLIIIDGIPIVQGNTGQLYNPVNALSDLNPNDIESVEVLKDAASAAIYGSRAAAGVILITTKKGKAGTLKVDYDMYVGYTEPGNMLEVLRASDYQSVINTMRSNAGLGNIINPGDFNGDGQNDETDWQKEVYRKGFTQNHQVSMSGGNARSNFFASLSYTDFENYIINNRLRRGSVRLNASTKATDWLTLGVNTQYSRRFQYGLGSGTGAAASGIPLGPLRYYPNVPVRNAAGDFYLNQGNNGLSIGIIPNPVAVLLANFDNNDANRILTSAYAEIQFARGLRFKSQYNIDYENQFTDQFWSPDVGDGSGLAGVAQSVYNYNINWSWFNTLNYNTKIGRDHDVSALAGMEFTKSKGYFLYASGVGVRDRSLLLLSASNYTSVNSSEGFGENGLASYFGALNYGYRNKYIANVNFRADAYSAFGKDNQFGYFPSASVGWRVSQEKFFSNVNFMNELKIRASYGVTGNSNIGNYTAFPSFAAVNYADLTAATNLNNPGNSKLKWERSSQLNIGADMSLFRRIDITADYYIKKSIDLILGNPILATIGFPGNTITENIGELETKGFELSVQSMNITRKDFSWTTNFNIAFNKNKVIATNAIKGDLFGGNGIARPGEDLGTYFLIRWAGVNPSNGLPMFYDVNGNIKMYNQAIANAANRWTDDKGTTVTTAIGAGDRVILKGKTPYPKFFGGLMNTVLFKGFDLSLDLQYAFGFYLFNTTEQGLSNYANVSNKTTAILKAWKQAGDQSDFPRLFWNDVTWSQASTRFLEKGDFVRIRNLQIGYTFSPNLISKFKLSKVRFYLQGQNLYTFTGYKGVDPEANANGNTNIGLGIDNNRPYLPRTLTMGLQISF